MKLDLNCARKKLEEIKTWKYTLDRIYPTLKERVDVFVEMLQEQYPDTKFMVKEDGDEYDIYHNKKYSDPNNKDFFVYAGEKFYDMFPAKGIDNVIFIYEDFDIKEL